MAFNNGAKLTMWEYEDKGGYGVANLTYRRKNKEGGYLVYGHKFCKIYDLAYEELKGVQIPNGGHVEIEIAKDAYTRTMNGKSFEQNPIEVDARWNAEKGRQDFDVKIYKLSVGKSVEGTEKPQENTESPAPKNDNPAPKQEEPSSNGLVGLDFLNIPDSNALNELPFR